MTGTRSFGTHRYFSRTSAASALQTRGGKKRHSNRLIMNIIHCCLPGNPSHLSRRPTVCVSVQKCSFYNLQNGSFASSKYGDTREEKIYYFVLLLYYGLLRIDVASAPFTMRYNHYDEILVYITVIIVKKKKKNVL